jgi:PAS domain S-box-containing protein
MEKNNSKDRVLIIAPVGRDAQGMAELLVGHGFEAQICGSLAECATHIQSGAGALILTEEALELASLSHLFEALAAQPSWSELPLIILATGGESRLARLLELTAEAAGSVTLLERPVHTTTLIRSLEVALTSRRRQYQVRDFLEEQHRKQCELEQAQDSLQRAKQFDDAVMENMGEGLYTVDSQGSVTFMNPAAEQLFGWTFGELRGRNIHEAVHYKHPDGSPFPVEECRNLQVLRLGKTLTAHEDCFIRKDGTFFDVIYSSSPLRAYGTTTGLVVVFRDVTAKKQAEEALRRAHEQLADRAKQLQTLVESRTAKLAKSNERLRHEMAEREALRRKLLQAQEEERRRIARELHDQMGQNLTALNVGLKSLLDGQSRSGLGSRVQHLQELATQTARDLHRVAVELRPAALDDLGLVKAIRALIETWSARYRIDVDFEAGQYKAAGISSEIETTLYRIIQEALNNVAKHSGATRVALVLRRTEEQVQAIIEDDGRGFDARGTSQSGNGSGRLGLLGIQERLGIVGGDFKVESTPDRGATLLVRIPIPKAHEKEKKAK